MIFRLGLWLKMRFVAVTGFLKWNICKKTSYIIGNKEFSGKICIFNLTNKTKSILQEQSLGTKGERRSQKKWARLYLKVPTDETIERSWGDESLEENLCILGVP